MLSNVFYVKNWLRKYLEFGLDHLILSCQYVQQIVRYLGVYALYSSLVVKITVNL